MTRYHHARQMPVIHRRPPRFLRTTRVFVRRPQRRRLHAYVVGGWITEPVIGWDHLPA